MDLPQRLAHLCTQIGNLYLPPKTFWPSLETLVINGFTCSPWNFKVFVAMTNVASTHWNPPLQSSCLY